MASSDAMPARVLRIVDASTNRIGEGLRLLEDVVRELAHPCRDNRVLFIMNDCVDVAPDDPEEAERQMVRTIDEVQHG